VQQKFLQWVDLPAKFEHASIGAYVSREPLNGTNAAGLVLDGVACTVDARWIPEDYINGLEYSNSVELKGHKCFKPSDCMLPEWTRINITEGWANYLNPITNTMKERNKTTFYALLEPTNPYSKISDIELLLAAFITDGITRSRATDENPNENNDGLLAFVNSGTAFNLVIPTE
jgi:hypothetical protein